MYCLVAGGIDKRLANEKEVKETHIYINIGVMYTKLRHFKWKETRNFTLCSKACHFDDCCKDEPYLVNSVDQCICRRPSYKAPSQNVRKATVSFVTAFRLSVRMEQVGFYRTDFHEVWYLSIFLKSVLKIQVSLKSDNDGGYFYTEVSVYLW